MRHVLLPLGIAAIALVVYSTRISREMTDFAVFRQAGARVLQAEPLYRAEDGHYQFKYLPASALAFVPSALMGPELAKVTWFAFSCGLLVFLLRWSVRLLPERRESQRLLLCLTLVAMAKFYGHELTLGQTNLLLATLLLAALGALEVEAPALAAGLFAVAVFVKPYALILLPWLAVTQGARVGGLAVAGIAFGLLLPSLVYGWQGNLDLLRAWFQTVTASTAPNLLVSDNVSFAGAWARWLGLGQPATLLSALSSAAALGLPAYAWSQRRHVESPAYLEVALLLLLIPLISPQGWDYVLLVGTPAVMCVMDRWRELSTSWRAFSATAIATMGLSLFDLMGRAMYSRFMASGAVTVCAAALAITLVHLRLRRLA